MYPEIRPRQFQSSTSSFESSSSTPTGTTSFSPTPTPTSTPIPTSQTPTLFSTAFTTSSPPSLSTTTSPSFSSEEPQSPSSSTNPTSPPSGFVFSTFTSSFVSNINGSPTTIVTPIVTAVGISASSRSSSHTVIIAASAAAAAIALLILALATLFCLRKRRRRDQRYWALSRAKRIPSSSRPPPTTTTTTTFLAREEEMDLPFPSPPFASSSGQQPDPFATPSSHRNSSTGGSSIYGDGGAPVYPRHSLSRSQSPSSHTPANVSLLAPLPPPSASLASLTPPRLLRARASESGSIFQESVWPPPSAASQLMDPLTHPSQSVDLARVITDVMGPPDSDPLLLLQPNTSSRDQGQGQGQEQEQGELGEDERRAAITPPSYIAPTNPSNWLPRSELQPPPSPSPPSSPPPGSGSESELPLRPPSTPWLSRPLNSSPKGSPLQRSLPL